MSNGVTEGEPWRLPKVRGSEGQRKGPAVGLGQTLLGSGLGCKGSEVEAREPEEDTA